MEGFIELLKKGKTQFHVTEECIKALERNGFKKLDFDEDWSLVPGEKYYTSPYSSSLVAFVYNKNCDEARIAMAHTDFPMLKVKPNPVFKKSDYVMLNVETYGGLIKETWFDRPLGIAGKVVVEGNNAFSPKPLLFDSKNPIFIIPNLAPHLKRDSKGEMDVQKEMIPLCSISKEPVDSTFLMNYLAKELNVTANSILDYDLYLYNYDSPTFVGFDNELLVSPRIDNISSVSAILEALIGCKDSKVITIGAMFDNEEIGSRSKQGADSVLLSEIVKKISPNLNYKKSFNISVDVAHATHPNYQEKSDITNTITLGDGVVLKTSASQRYVTDSEAGAVITALAKEGEIKIQKQVNRSGMPGGQTLGPIASSYLPLKSVDLGIPMLAMHSACETIHYDDYIELVKLLTYYFGY